LARIWIGVAAYAALLAAVALLAARLGGPQWGWLLALAGLALPWLRQVRNLGRLIAWAQTPIGTPVPYAGGLWGRAFAALSQRARNAQVQRQRLSSELERQLDAAQAIPDGVVILNRRNGIEWMNNAAQAQFGLRVDQDLGAPITNLVRQPEFMHVIESGAFVEPTLIRSPRSSQQLYSVQVIPFGESQKLILSRDVTHVERLETMRRDFVANVSHELKTPLTVVLGFVETLADSYRDLSAEEAERFLALAREQAQRMRRLVEDLLTLAELETGSPPAFDEEVDVQRLLEEIVQDTRALSGDRHEVIAYPGPPALLLGTQRELHSAFANLASNAVRYTPEGGRIEIGWDIGADGGGSFTVRDSGIGIEARHLPRLTERFYRIDRSRSRESGGTGLGLAIVKHVLTRHQAQLEIASEPGQGSSFTARFPTRRVVRRAAADAGARS
jgi:two-component system phosphate regulon sensor histidine kinase PhoR